MKTRLPAGSTEKIRIVFLIRSLQAAGAERQLSTLVTRMDRNRFDPLVYCFYPGGEFEQEVLRAGVPVFSLEKKGRWDWITFTMKVVRELRKLNPHILHGYVEVPNILAVLVKPFVPGVRTVLGLRGSGGEMSLLPMFMRISFTLQPFFSRWADLCIANSSEGKAHWAGKGIRKDKICVIPNGFDTQRFHPDRSARKAVRERLGIPEKNICIGTAGRLYPGKGTEIFLQAAALLLAKNPGLTFVWAGDGNLEYRSELGKLAVSLGITGQVLFPGVVKDICALNNALDIFCLPSNSEGFPNVLAEAMACELPCVSTDVGDVQDILGDAGFIVPPRDPQALADALQRMIDLPSEESQRMGMRARAHIVDNYSVEKMVARTQDVLEALLH